MTSIEVPVLDGPGGLRLRPPRDVDVAALEAIRAEPSVIAFWDVAEPGETAAAVRGDEDVVFLVIEVGDVVAGAIQFHEEPDPAYRHAGIDIYLGAAFQGRGHGTAAVSTLAAWLFAPPPAGRGHHRLVIDPSAANAAAIRAYARAGFSVVGRMRQYERGPDGTFHDGLLMELLRDDLQPAGA